MDYTFFANLQQEFTLPEKGILSRVLYKDEKVNVTLFGFAPGEELSAHSAPTPAVLYFLEGQAELAVRDGQGQSRGWLLRLHASNVASWDLSEDRAPHVVGSDERPILTTSREFCRVANGYELFVPIPAQPRVSVPPGGPLR